MSFHERFKINSNIIISLSCALLNDTGHFSFDGFKPAIGYYNEDLEVHDNNVDLYMVLVKNEFELWKQI